LRTNYRVSQNNVYTL